jgi:hypothetical protein
MKNFEIVYVAPAGVSVRDTAEALSRSLFSELPTSAMAPSLCAVFGHGPHPADRPFRPAVSHLRSSH